MTDRILTAILSRLTARRAMLSFALGLILLPHNAEANRKGKRRKKKKRELRKRWARRNVRIRRRAGRRSEAQCLDEEAGNVCPDEIYACCHYLRDLDVDGYCWCLLTETCGSCCVGYPGCDN